MSRVKVAPCTVIHAVLNNPVSNDHILRDNIIEVEKCITEGALTKEIICLGWTLNTRELRTKLPKNKYKA